MEIDVMHTQSLENWTHEHVFLGSHHERNEQRTWLVITLCGVMMLVEIVGGIAFGSMALLADGLHMSTHAGAFLIAAIAYTYARRHANDDRFTFGTGKLGELAAFASAIVLAMIAFLIGYEAITRLIHPVAIAFDEAIPVAILGLCVNIGSAWLLRDDHDPEHHHRPERDDHNHSHGHDHHSHRDLNLRAAYIHVLADAAVSVLAIVGLLAGRQLGWLWMDAVMGIAGALVIGNWSWSLIRAAGAALLDMRPHNQLANTIRRRLEAGGSDRVYDLHVWRVGPGHHAAIVSLVSDSPRAPSVYKTRLAGLSGLSHLSIEVEACLGDHIDRQGH
jgi:cation diffusion facilitator family transporter